MKRAIAVLGLIALGAAGALAGVIAAEELSEWQTRRWEREWAEAEALSEPPDRSETEAHFV